MAASANFGQMEARESEPCAEASDSENLAESSGFPSADPPGQDQGTSGDAAIALIIDGKQTETFIKTKSNIYLILFLKKALAKPASSLPSAFQRNSGCWLKVTNLRAFGGVAVESVL